MVEPVARLLNGRGHRVVRARDAGLAAEQDADIIEYCLRNELVVVTFDGDFRDSALRAGCRCVHIRHPEITARGRLREHMDGLMALLDAGVRLATLPSSGPPHEGRRPVQPRK